MIDSAYKRRAAAGDMTPDGFMSQADRFVMAMDYPVGASIYRRVVQFTAYIRRSIRFPAFIRKSITLETGA